MSAKKGFELLKNISVYLKNTETYDRVLSSLKFIDGGDGKATAELTLKPEHLNKMGGLHGGLSSTIVDSVTTFALMTKDIENIRSGVSVDLHLTFLKGAKENDEILIQANTIRCGRTLAFLECEIRNKKDNSLLVKGAHTKFVGQN
ncbi:hypothetical protein PVAND_015816 [Polypedilum vanderplanki]|uniref:Thioesterase domain-containing protein n=1 Tax=Polypedilum vanderplanki TaxID=319348 RepID=A0A9J6BDZ9_POLVA|nr:hypothetical protein PVAND_015816 [Polypedilum vanderplanki]